MREEDPLALTEQIEEDLITFISDTYGVEVDNLSIISRLAMQVASELRQLRSISQQENEELEDSNEMFEF